LKKTLFLLLTLYINIFPQSKTNLEIISELADRSTEVFSLKLKENLKIYPEFIFPSKTEILKVKLSQSLTDKNLLVTSEEDSADYKLQISIDKIVVNYEEMFKNNFLGSYYTKRTIGLEGNFNLYKNSFLNETGIIKEKYADTILVDKIQELENISYPFTQGDIPTEPFFSSLLEPITAISAVGLALVLFFTVRSK